MPTAVGPNPALDSNIVFSYDTGDTSNSYRGEPTTNLLTYSTNFSAGPWYGYCGNSSNVTPNTTEVVDPFGGFNATKVVRNNQTICDGSTPGWGLIYSSGGILTSGNTYTTSIYARCASGTMTMLFGISDYYVASVTLTEQWQRFSFASNYTAPAQTDRVFQFYSTDQNVTYYVCAAQTEPKNHATQYVASGASQGTRSVTQGLLPLISNTSLNISTVSFNSNAQIVFDGTDDYINAGSIQPFTLSSRMATWETVVKFGTSSGAHAITTKWNNSTGQIWWFGRYPTTKIHIAMIIGGSYYPYYSDGDLSSTSNHYHIVVTLNDTILSYYINGALDSTDTVAAGTWATDNGNPDLIIGAQNAGTAANFNGSIPILKMYNTTLSADQVKQNYQQYKTRFNLS